MILGIPLSLKVHILIKPVIGLSESKVMTVGLSKYTKGTASFVILVPAFLQYYKNYSRE